MMNNGSRVIVIGGGIIGIASADYLQQQGLQVTLIDQDRVGAACSHANCGLISPSHILPLPKPAALKMGLQAVLMPGGPLSIRPGWNVSLWKWLYRFAGHCNQNDMLSTGHARQQILESSRDLYQQLIDSGLQCEWQTRGCLFVDADQASFEHHATEVELIEREYGVTFEPYIQQQLTDLEPALIPGAAYGGWFFEQDAHLRPDRLIESWRSRLLQQSVEIIEHCRFERFVAEGARVRGIETTSGPLDCDQVVIATGAVTPWLNRELGLQVPIQPGKGYSLTMTRPAICPQIPMIFEKERVAITPMKSVYRIGSTMELAGYTTNLNRQRLELLKQGACRYLQQPFGETVLEEWFGWRPMTPDGKPIIDFATRYRNVLLACGHNMLGLSMAPATGKLVAELLTSEKPHIDIGPFQYPRNRLRQTGQQ